MWSRLQQPDVIEAATLSVQASLTKPADLNPPEKGQAEFEKKFGLSWKSVRRHWLTYIERAGGVPARHTHQGLPYEGSTLGLPGLPYTRTPSRGLHLPYTRTTVLARFRPCLLTFTCLLTCSLLTRLATSLARTLLRSYALTFLLAGPRRGPCLQRRRRLQEARHRRRHDGQAVGCRQEGGPPGQVWRRLLCGQDPLPLLLLLLLLLDPRAPQLSLP